MDKDTASQDEKRGRANLRVGLTLPPSFVFFLGVIAKYVLMPS